MILYEIFTNHLVYLLPEFFLTTILLFLLLYGVFYKNINNQKILIIKNTNTILIYLLILSLLLTINFETMFSTLLNGVFFINNFT